MASGGTRAFLDGVPATADELAPLAFAGNAHFTAMQVRAGKVRGLDLHLRRLRSASDLLFGSHQPDDRIRSLLASAISATAMDVSLSCFAFARSDDGNADGVPSILIRTSEPVQRGLAPIALRTFAHERHLPQVKHVGEIAKFRFRREAENAGADDAAFVDREGRLSEASIWNLAFWDGQRVIWPDAQVLPGVTQQVLRRQLTAQGVAQTDRAVRPADLPGRLAGVVMNSWTPAVPISRIDAVPVLDGSTLAALLHDAYRREPPVAP